MRGYPGTRGHEFEDARLYASWGVDFLKYDWCNTDSLNTREAYRTMHAALDSTGRPIVFSICEWGSHQPWLWAGGVGELYRTTGDITASFAHDKDMGGWTALSVVGILDRQIPIRKYNGPNHWNDPDMLEVGNGMTNIEDKSHFSLWCMLAAPLAAGNDLRKMSAQTREILTNKEMIAIDQDSLGISAFKMDLPDSVELWVKPLKNDRLGTLFFQSHGQHQKNKSGLEGPAYYRSIIRTESEFWRNHLRGVKCMGQKNQGVTKTDKKLEYSLPSHDVLVFKMDTLN